MKDAKKNVKGIDKNVEEFINKQKKELEAILNPVQMIPAKVINPVMAIKVKPPQFLLKKLPIWGLQISPDKINFEWPTQDLLNQMDGDVRLKSLNFKTNENGRLASVECNLDDG